VSLEQKEKCISRISDTLQELHKMDIVWSDAKRRMLLLKKMIMLGW